MSLSFFMPSKVIGGDEAVIKNSFIFSSLGKKAIIITGKSSAEKSGALNDVKVALDRENIEYTVYNKINENPLLSLCFEAGKTAYDFSADFMIGIGGGSVLDATKAAAIFADNPNFSQDDIYTRKIPAKHLKTVLIGTTSGTGSEVSSVSVMTHDKTGVKKSISGPDCYADYVFADDRYTFSMPYNTTVSTALDALAHITEGFFSPKMTESEMLFANEGIPMLVSALKEINETKALPNENLRRKLYTASLYAGMVLNTCGTGFPHPLGYVLTEYKGIPHGKACTYFYEFFLSRAKEFEREKFDKFIRLTKIKEDELIRIVNELTDIKVCFTDEEKERIKKRFTSNPPRNFQNSPGGFSVEDILNNNLYK